MKVNPQTLPPVEVLPRDIAAYRDGGSGVDYVHRLDSGRPGPCVVVSGLIHGNEICGMTAVTWLIDHGARPVRGSLTLMLGNVAAYRRFDPARLDIRVANRFVDRDLNRCWSDAFLAGPDDGVEARRARELLPFVDAADALLDLHSTTYSARPFFAFRDISRNRALADALGFPWSHLLLEPSTKHSGTMIIERERFGEPDGAAVAIGVECGSHYARATGETAIQVVLRFLDHFEILDPEFVRRHCRARPLEATTRYRIHEVYRAATDDARFVRPFIGFEEVRAGETILVDGDRAITAPFDRCAVLWPWPIAGRGRELMTLARIVD